MLGFEASRFRHGRLLPNRRHFWGCTLDRSVRLREAATVADALDLPRVRGHHQRISFISFVDSDPVNLSNVVPSRFSSADLRFQSMPWRFAV